MSQNNPKIINCQICAATELTRDLEVYDDRYGFPGKFSLVKCAKCGHRSLDGSFEAAALSSLYTNYYPRSTFHVDDHRPHGSVGMLQAWFDGLNSSAFRWVPKQVRILDIGCGYGESLGYHKSRGCDVYGVEADKNILRVAAKYGYNVHAGLFNPNLHEQNYFDYVTLDQVIEHATKPVPMLQDIVKVLKPGGYIIISTPNSSGWGSKIFGWRWINWHAPYHLQHFTFESMKIAAQHAGLVLEKAETITKSSWLFFQWLHLVAYPNEGHPSAFWSSKETLNVPQKIIFKVLTLMHRLKINHILTRFFDAIALGDNYLFFLRKP